MVDFNNETTIATPPGEVIKMVILERREQCIESIEAYYNIESSDIDTSHKTARLRACIMALWFELQAMIRRRLTEQEYEEVESGIRSSKSFQDLITSYEWLNKFVDDLGLTFIDSRAHYDRSRVEESNKRRGL